MKAAASQSLQRPALNSGKSRHAFIVLSGQLGIVHLLGIKEMRRADFKNHL